MSNTDEESEESEEASDSNDSENEIDMLDEMMECESDKDPTLKQIKNEEKMVSIFLIINIYVYAYLYF